jgi:hypothetical protein
MSSGRLTLCVLTLMELLVLIMGHDLGRKIRCLLLGSRCNLLKRVLIVKGDVDMVGRCCQADVRCRFRDVVSTKYVDDRRLRIFFWCI